MTIDLWAPTKFAKEVEEELILMMVRSLEVEHKQVENSKDSQVK